VVREFESEEVALHRRSLSIWKRQANIKRPGKAMSETYIRDFCSIAHKGRWLTNYRASKTQEMGREALGVLLNWGTGEPHSEALRKFRARPHGQLTYSRIAPSQCRRRSLSSSVQRNGSAMDDAPPTRWGASKADRGVGDQPLAYDRIRPGAKQLPLIKVADDTSNGSSTAPSPAPHSGGLGQ
jgi:hypothetical protein